MIYEEEDFSPRFDVVSCFIEVDGSFLALLRHPKKPQGLTWSLPAGKVSGKEDFISAIQREVFEELGIKLKKEDIKYTLTTKHRYPGYDFNYHMHRIKLKEKPNIQLKEDENIEYRWVTPLEALKLKLIEDDDYCIKKVYNL